jgi:hypothetical protein
MDYHSSPVAFEPRTTYSDFRERRRRVREVSSLSPSHGPAQGPPLYPVYQAGSICSGQSSHIPLPPPFPVSVVLMPVQTIPKLNNIWPGLFTNPSLRTRCANLDGRRSRTVAMDRGLE